MALKMVAFGFFFSQGTDFVWQISGAFYTTLCHIELREFFCRVLDFACLDKAVPLQGGGEVHIHKRMSNEVQLVPRRLRLCEKNKAWCMKLRFH